MSGTNETLAEAVRTVFEALNDDGAEAFEALCLAHGLLWRCGWCGDNNPCDLAVCDGCRKQWQTHPEGDQ